MEAVGRENLPKLRDFMDNEGIDTVIFSYSDVNATYFSNFSDNSILAITKDKRILFTFPLELGRAKEQADTEEIVNVEKFNNSVTNAISKKIKCKKIGVVKSYFSLHFYESLRKRMRIKFVDIENFLNGLRAVKLKKEIGLIKKSTKISNSAIGIIEETLNEVVEGRKITETELSNRISSQLGKNGTDSPFGILVASGERTFHPHVYPYASEKIIKKGLGYVDFGSSYRGYCSDVTVPFVIGRIDEQMRKVVKTTVEAYELAIDSIEVGLPTWELHEKINNFIKSKGYKFIHSLGHGLGLAIHDVPSISPKPLDKLQLRCWREEKFKENMIFTIEPGIYTPKGGCRLENDVLLTKKGPVVLTNSRLIEMK